MSHGGLEVSGGAGGIEARYADLEALAAQLDALGDTVTGYALRDVTRAADGDLMTTAVLSPGTFAAAEAAILDASGKLLGRSLSFEVTALATRANIAISRWVDEATEQMWYSLTFSLGYAARVSPAAALGVLGLGALSASTGQDQMVGGAYDGLLDGLGDDPRARIGLGLLKQLPEGNTVGGLAGDVYDGLYGGRRHGDIETLPTTDENRQKLPGSVEDLTRSINTANGAESGAFTVQQIVGTDGRTRWVVQLPGTDFGDWGSSRDSTSNLQLMDGGRTSYGDSVGKALIDAGVGHGDPVLMVGHSQGGMQAMNLLDDPDFDYNVRGVVTVGSPVGHVDPPDDVPILNIEHGHDIVPGTDGAANHAGPQQVTVTGEVDTGSVLGNHDLDRSYLPIARMVDESSDPSVRRIIDSFADDGFLSDAGATTQTRAYRSVVAD